MADASDDQYSDEEAARRTAYPTSLLAKKTKVLLYDLLSQCFPTKLPREISGMMALSRARNRWSLGKTFFLINVNFIMPAIIAGIVILAAMILAHALFAEPGRHLSQQAVDYLALVVAVQNNLISDEGVRARVAQEIDKG